MIMIRFLFVLRAWHTSSTGSLSLSHNACLLIHCRVLPRPQSNVWESGYLSLMILVSLELQVVHATIGISTLLQLTLWDGGPLKIFSACSLASFFLSITHTHTHIHIHIHIHTHTPFCLSGYRPCCQWGLDFLLYYSNITANLSHLITLCLWHLPSLFSILRVVLKTCFTIF